MLRKDGSTHGKTVLIDVLAILETVLSGRSLSDDCINYITIGKELAHFVYVFEIKSETEKFKALMQKQKPLIVTGIEFHNMRKTHYFLSKVRYFYKIKGAHMSNAPFYSPLIMLYNIIVHLIGFSFYAIIRLLRGVPY